MPSGTAVITAAAIYLASSAALRPVEKMRRRAAEITGTEPSARLRVPGTQDEIARLGHTLNEMIARLEDALTRQRELTQNGSHELRTPLTVLTSEIELALHQDLDPAARDAMSTALEEARRVSRVDDDLLTLARVEEGALPVAQNSWTSTNSSAQPRHAPPEPPAPEGAPSVSPPRRSSPRPTRSASTKLSPT